MLYHLKVRQRQFRLNLTDLNSKRILYSHFLLTLDLEHLVDGIYEQQRDEDKGDLETVLHLGDDFCALKGRCQL